jgi:hypothetical protein
MFNMIQGEDMLVLRCFKEMLVTSVIIVTPERNDGDWKTVDGNDRRCC